MQKRRLIEDLRTALRAELAVAEQLARETAAAANHPEARPENDKDTRKIELSYLAAGQANRAKALETAVALLASMPVRDFGAEEPLQVGALVEIEVEGKAQRVFLSPSGGGMKIRDGEGDISIVTPEAPLGRALLGRTAGESFELTVAGRTRDVEILGAT
jgi:transcription elongation GreA/GreB family factor